MSGGGNVSAREKALRRQYEEAKAALAVSDREFDAAQGKVTRNGDPASVAQQ